MRVALAAGIAIGVSLTGCAVGWPYSYAGQQHTMTKENSDYHAKAIADVRTRYGDPNAQDDAAKLKRACELLQRYAAKAPDPGSFTPARELLDHDARATCEKARRRDHEEKAQAANERWQAEAEQERQAARVKEEARQRQHEARRQEDERQRLTSALERASRTAEICDATEAARSARKRRQAILDQSPGALVRKQCTPRMETRTVKAECKDANGFTRPCTKTVAGSDVAGYTCPKNVDPEVVQLGLYQLDLLDAYPYPEDRKIAVRDVECEPARARVKELREKLGVTSATAEVAP
ncbi:MAG: hypothetical protein KF819_18320 [Labilithrix sp.]|nr:hypothetical protein [Labilithrix sp.]